MTPPPTVIPLILLVICVYVLAALEPVSKVERYVEILLCRFVYFCSLAIFCQHEHLSINLYYCKTETQPQAARDDDTLAPHISQTPNSLNLNLVNKLQWLIVPIVMMFRRRASSTFRPIQSMVQKPKNGAAFDKPAKS